MQDKLKIFLGSSSESAEIMRAIEVELNDRGYAPIPWVGQIGIARSTLDELWRLAHQADFAVFIWAADAQLEDRGNLSWATRDNVIYESGLFAGVLSPERVFLVVEARDHPKIKIPSDYLGFGYASCIRSDSASIRSAAIEIQKAIIRAREDMLQTDPSFALEGFWIDSVVNRDDRSVISTFELRRNPQGVLEIVNGHTWDPDGEQRARFWSTSSKFDSGTRTLTYSWQGVHPKEAGMAEYFGVGQVVFLPDQNEEQRATGWFSSTARTSLDKTSLVSRVCKKTTENEAKSFISENRSIRQEAVDRLLNWRREIS